MANIVQQIYDAVKAEVASQLGSSYKELPFVYEVEKNDLRRIQNGYGVRHLSAVNSESTTRVYCLDHGFEVILAKANGRTDNDADAQTAINALYDQIDTMLKSMILKKLGLTSIILVVNDPNIQEPELVNDNQFIVMRFGFNVKYRQSIT